MSIPALEMSKKTFMLDKRIEKKLRFIQGQLITSDEKNWSLSKIINILLLHALLTTKEKDPSFDAIKAFLNGKRVELDDSAIDSLIALLHEDKL